MKVKKGGNRSGWIREQNCTGTSTSAKSVGSGPDPAITPRWVRGNGWQHALPCAHYECMWGCLTPQTACDSRTEYLKVQHVMTGRLQREQCERVRERFNLWPKCFGPCSSGGAPLLSLCSESADCSRGHFDSFYLVTVHRLVLTRWHPITYLLTFTLWLVKYSHRCTLKKYDTWLQVQLITTQQQERFHNVTTDISVTLTKYRFILKDPDCDIWIWVSHIVCQL